MNQKLVLLLIGLSVILCLVALNLMFIYFIIDNPYQTTRARRTLPTEAPTWAPIPQFDVTLPPLDVAEVASEVPPPAI